MDSYILQGSMLNSGWLYFSISFVVCIVCLPLAVRLSPRFGLVDQPDNRKKHRKDTPLVGGLCILSALLITPIILGAESISWTIYAWLSVVLVVGVVDDFLDLSYRVRILLHVGVVVGIWMTDALIVSTVGSVLTAENAVTFGLLFGVTFTAFAVVGAVNSVNMIDGVDGLLATLFLISISSVLVVSNYSIGSIDMEGAVFRSSDIATMLGATTAFLLMNARVVGGRPAQVFLGDAGSTLLGFLLVYVLIDYTQEASALFSPVVAGWIIGVPLLDASAVIATRLLRGRSPVSPGRDHIHHILLDKGFGVNSVVLALSTVQMVMILMAVVLDQTQNPHSDQILFWGFALLVIIHTAVTYQYSKASLSSARKKHEAKQDVNVSSQSVRKRIIKKAKSGEAVA